MAVSQDDKKIIKPRRLKSEKPPAKPAAQMTFFEHLNELRSRLVWCAAVVLAGTVVGWIFRKELVQAFLDLGEGTLREIAARTGGPTRFTTLDAVSNFSVYFEVALYAGFLLASPVLVYHILAFMAPALEPESQPGDPGHEGEVKMLKSIRRSLVFFIPLVALFFIGGIAFAYYAVLPSAVKFLFEFGADQFTLLPTAKTFINQMSKIMFWSGLVFELPIFLFLLAKIKVVTWKKLAGFWKWALVLSLVVATFITPSPDLFFQAVIGMAVFGLFWLGVLFARFA